MSELLKLETSLRETRRRGWRRSNKNNETNADFKSIRKRPELLLVCRRRDTTISFLNSGRNWTPVIKTSQRIHP